MAANTRNLHANMSASARARRWLRLFQRALIYGLLLAGAVLVLIPLAWTISTALKNTQQTLAYPPAWIPSPVMWSNFREALTAVPFGTYFRNSLVIGVLRVIGTTISSAVVAYGFARVQFPGRNLLFMLVLSTMMIPFHVLIIPRFMLFRSLGWLDTLLPLIVPGFFGAAFSIFLLRQYMLGIPRELDEAARIDGCNHFSIFWRIVLPLTKPALGAVAVFEFLDSWDDFLGPLIYLSSEKNYTVELGLNAFRTQYFTEWNLFMAASLVAMLLPITIFFIAQRYFLDGVALTGSGGVKG